MSPTARPASAISVGTGVPRRSAPYDYIPALLFGYPNGIINLIPISIVLDKQDAEQRKIQAGAVFCKTAPACMRFEKNYEKMG